MEESEASAGLKTMQLNDQKAGMQGLDKELINKVIYEASKGTPYFAFQEKRQQSINSKVNDLNSILSKITDKERRASLEKMDLLGAMLDSKRDVSRSIVHIDMDAFYAAVEVEDNPKLKGKPVAVGSSSMLSTSSYEARKYGVRAAMPGFIAKKLCPELIIVPVNFARYRSVSKEVCQVVNKYDPNYSAASLDEMYLDLTEYIHNVHKNELHRSMCLRASTSLEESDETYRTCLECCVPITNERRDALAYEIVQEIRKEIHCTTKLTASAGIAPNVMLAKVCSDQNKPNGQYQIESTVEAVMSFISTLPVKKVSGIGPVQGQILNAIGINTCSDMWQNRDVVHILFKPTSADFYLHVARGIGSTRVKSDHVRKSIGVEQTFKEIHQQNDLHQKCKELCLEAVEDMVLHNMMGKVVVLKFKTTSFESHTRNHTLPCYSAEEDVIYKAAKRLLDSEIAAATPRLLRLRLMGIRIANLAYKDSIPSIEKQTLKIRDFLTNQQNICGPVAEGTSNCPREEGTNEVLEMNINSYVDQKTMPESDFSEAPLPAALCEVSENTVDSVCYDCPICRVRLKLRTLNEFNSHIDQCLNKQTIKEILARDLLDKKRKQDSIERQSVKKAKLTSRTERKIEEYFQ